MPLLGMISIDLANDPDMVGYRDDFLDLSHHTRFFGVNMYLPVVLAFTRVPKF